MSVDSRGNIAPKTPEVAYLAAHTYLMATQPATNDPRAALHKTAMASIGLMGAALANKEVLHEPTDPRAVTIVLGRMTDHHAIRTVLGK